MGWVTLDDKCRHLEYLDNMGSIPCDYHNVRYGDSQSCHIEPAFSANFYHDDLKYRYLYSFSYSFYFDIFHRDARDYDCSKCSSNLYQNVEEFLSDLHSRFLSAINSGDFNSLSNYVFYDPDVSGGWVSVSDLRGCVCEGNDYFFIANFHHRSEFISHPYDCRLVFNQRLEDIKRLLGA